MRRSLSRSWLLWGLPIIVFIVIFAPYANAQDIVTLYVGNVDGSPFQVPYQGTADIPIWVNGPIVSGGEFSLIALNEFVSLRTGGNFYPAWQYQFGEPQYLPLWSSQTLVFWTDNWPPNTLFHLADFSMTMDVDSSYYNELVDALFIGVASFSDPSGYFLYDTISHVSQLYIEGPLSIPESDNRPQSFVLHSAYPNPFNASTTISFTLAVQSDVNLFIYDITGRKIKSFRLDNLPAGEKSLVWNGVDDSDAPVASGTYLFRLVCRESVATTRVTLLK
jgi:hypothetical protein